MADLRVMMVASSYPRDAGDWTGRFIYDQAAALARCGVALALWAPPGELPQGVRSALSRDDAQWLTDLLRRGGIAHLLRTRPLAGAVTGWQLLRRLATACRTASADFYLINWLQNALALPDDGRPAVVTVLGSDLALLRIPGMVAALRRQFRRRRTCLAPNAAWMQPRLLDLFGDVAEIAPNPFGVGAEWFSVKREPPERRHGWLVVARITRGKLGTLLEWGEGLFSAARPLHLLGPMQEQIDLPAWVRQHGPTHPQALRETWFPQAVGLLTLSQHDEGRPQVMIEAMAAGLPVIASRLAAHEDLVGHDANGWLVASREELAAALDAAALPANAARVGAAAQAFVRNEIGTWDDCALRYVAALRKLQEPRHAR